MPLSKLAATCGVGTAPRVLHQQQHEQAPHRWHIVWQRQHRRMAMANPFSGCPKTKTIPCLTRVRAKSGRWNLIRIFLAKKPKKTLTWSACFLDPRLRPRIANFHILIVAAKLAPQVASCVKRNWWQQCHLLLELPAASQWNGNWNFGFEFGSISGKLTNCLTDPSTDGARACYAPRSFPSCGFN